MGKAIAIFVGIILLVGGLYSIMSTEVVEGGHAAVITHHGQYSSTTGPGRSFEPGWSTAYHTYDTRWQNVEYLNHDPNDTDSKADRKDWHVSTNSSDGTAFTITATFRYRTPIESLETIYDEAARDDDQVWNKIVNTTAREVIREVSTTTPIRSIYLDDRAGASDRMFAELTTRLERFGIELDSFSIKEVAPPTAYVENIQKQQDEYEAAQLAEAETVTAQQNAEKAAVVAQGEADAGIIRAEGQARENEIVSASLTPELIQIRYYEALEQTSWAILSPGDVQPTLPVQEPTEEPQP